MGRFCRGPRAGSQRGIAAPGEPPARGRAPFVAPRTLRAWVVRGGAVLCAALAAFVAVQALRVPAAAPHLAIPPAALGADAAPLSRGPGFEVEPLLALLGRFSGPGAEGAARRPAGPAAATVPGPLALGAIEVGAVATGDGGEPLVFLRSKDPAQAFRAALRPGEERGGVRLEAVRSEGGALWADLARGDERFSVRFAPRGLAASLAAREAPRRPAPRIAAALAPMGLKCVPYAIDASGRRGVRVTGIDPQGPFAGSGLSAGDVVASWGEDAGGDPRAIEVRWREGWRPARAVVLDAATRRERTVDLALR